MKRHLLAVILFYVTCKVYMLASRIGKSVQTMRLARAFSFYSSNHNLVSTEWVYNRLGDVKILDTTRHISPHEDAKSEFEVKHLPEAQFLDLETLCQKGPEKIKKLPTPEMFKETMESLGISDKDEIVLYDSQGIYSSARAWFMFRVFNKDVKIHVMNGGLIRWETEKYPIESGKGVSVNKSSFSLKTDTSLVYTTEEMKQRVKEYKSGLLKRTAIDARRECCFHGTCHVPIPNIPRGHIPGSINIPFHYITDPYNNYMIRSPQELKTIFDKHGVFVQEPEKMIFTCDYGMSACVDLFAMYLLGRPLEGHCAVYDGSWMEYALDESTEKELC